MTRTSTPRTTSKTAPGPRPPGEAAAQADPAVEAFLRELEHPRKPEIEAVRRIILGVSPTIREGIKWNAPSFRTTEYFATFHLRTRDSVRLVLHTGAKARATAATGLDIPDPSGLLQWLAKDRCLVSLADGAQVEARRAALEAILRAWIRHL